MFEISKRVRVIVGLIGSLILCIWGVYGLISETPISTLSFIPILFAVGGFVGFIGGIIELKKVNDA